MKMKNIAMLMVLASSTLMMACSKEENRVPLQLRLTDLPATYEEVNVEIVGMEIKTSKDTAKWYAIETKAGVYNLLDFQNGITTVIAEGEVPQAILKEIRFNLGTNNSIISGGQSYPMSKPLKEDAGLVVKVDKQLQETLNTITLDFVASESVKEESPGVFKLQPKILLKPE